MEISVTTSIEHEIENFKKCVALGFSHFLFIAPQKTKRERMAKLAKGFCDTLSFASVAPDELVSALDGVLSPAVPTDSVVRGYNVRVSRQRLTPEDALGKRSAIAQVIARSLQKK